MFCAVLRFHLLKEISDVKTIKGIVRPRNEKKHEFSASRIKSEPIVVIR